MHIFALTQIAIIFVLSFDLTNSANFFPSWCLVCNWARLRLHCLLLASLFVQARLFDIQRDWHARLGALGNHLG